MDITAGGDFLGLCDQKSSYKHVPDFGRLRSYGRFTFFLGGEVFTDAVLNSYYAVSNDNMIHEK